jgi:hypothetical protein
VKQHIVTLSLKSMNSEVLELQKYRRLVHLQGERKQNTASRDTSETSVAYAVRCGPIELI